MSIGHEDIKPDEEDENFFKRYLRNIHSCQLGGPNSYYENYNLPMVFGTETEFALTYGRMLNEERSRNFSVVFPESVFLYIIKKIVEKMNAFVRDPEKPWLREGLNHFENEGLKIIAEAAVSDNFSHLPKEIREMIKEIKLSPRDFYLGLVGIFLGNGSRLYVDNGHLESSISECRDPYETICHEKAMERIIMGVLPEVENTVGREIIILKDNTDRRGNSYGCHSNYLLQREFFPQLYIENKSWSNAWLSFLVSSIIYTGSGKVGYESGEACDYQISQRADHLKSIYGTDTMRNRSLINLRNEPLADRTKWSRFHVILDDSNMAEWSNYLKIGTKALVLNMLQYQFLEKEPSVDYQNLFIANPVKALKMISRDLTCKKPIDLLNGGKKSALEIQKEWLKFVEYFYSNSHHYRARWIKDVIEKWGEVLNWIENDDSILDSVLDWRIKNYLIVKIIEKHAQKGNFLNWQSNRIRDLDGLYHDLRPRGLYNLALKSGMVERIVEDEHIKKAMIEPPEETRAWLRGQFIKRFLPHLTDVSWELLAFYLKISDFKTLVKLDIDPLGSTQSKVGKLFEQNDNHEEFFRKFLSIYLTQKNLF